MKTKITLTLATDILEFDIEDIVLFISKQRGVIVV